MKEKTADIDILEEFIPLLEDGYVDNKDCTKEIQAIENLIKENKELKEENIRLNDEMQLVRNSVIIGNIDIIDEYIPKSKVEAKIEEVSNGTYDAKIVLQSLLGKE